MTAPEQFTTVAHGHPAWTIDVRDAEMYDAWLSTLGPSACVLWQHLAREMGQGRDAFTIAGLAAYSGLMTGKVIGALDRLALFHRIHWPTDTVASVEVACIPPRQGRQRSHDAEVAAWLESVTP